jgi:hypothetical protein
MGKEESGDGERRSVVTEGGRIPESRNTTDYEPQQYWWRRTVR